MKILNLDNYRRDKILGIGIFRPKKKPLNRSYLQRMSNELKDRLEECFKVKNLEEVQHEKSRSCSK